MDVLIAYYSFEGNTKLISRTIARGIGADCLEIEPVKEMKTKSFLKYVIGGFQVITNRIPELKPLDKDVRDYDLIFIGTPVWVGSPSTPVRAFIDQADLSGKEIALFCCHKGGAGSTLEKMRLRINGAEILGQEEFFSPLEKEKEKTIAEAFRWAREIVKNADKSEGVKV